MKLTITDSNDNEVVIEGLTNAELSDVFHDFYVQHFPNHATDVIVAKQRILMNKGKVVLANHVSMID